MSKEIYEILGGFSINPCQTWYTITQAGKAGGKCSRAGTCGLIAYVSSVTSTKMWISTVVTRVGKKGKDRLESYVHVVPVYTKLLQFIADAPENETLIETRTTKNGDCLLELSNIDFLAWLKAKINYITYIASTYNNYKPNTLGKTAAQVNKIRQILQTLNVIHFKNAKTSYNHVIKLKEEAIALSRYIEGAMINRSLMYDRNIYEGIENALFFFRDHLPENEGLLKDTITMEMNNYDDQLALINSILESRRL